MDPQTAWDRMLAALAANDWDQVKALSESLLSWLARSGFPPVVLGHPMFSPDLERALAMTVGRYCLRLAQAKIITQSRSEGDAP